MECNSVHITDISISIYTGSLILPAIKITLHITGCVVYNNVTVQFMGYKYITYERYYNSQKEIYNSTANRVVEIMKYLANIAVSTNVTSSTLNVIKNE